MHNGITKNTDKLKTCSRCAGAAAFLTKSFEKGPIRIDFLSPRQARGLASPPCTPVLRSRGMWLRRQDSPSQHLGTWQEPAFPGTLCLDTELIILIMALGCSHCEMETGLSSVKVWLKGIK